MRVSMACESLERKAKGSSNQQKNEPFTIGVVSSGHEGSFEFLHHKNRSIKQIQPFNPMRMEKMEKMENLSDIMYKDSDEKTSKGNNPA